MTGPKTVTRATRSSAGTEPNASFATAEVALADAHLLADHSGILYWPSERLLVVADLHLEKGSSLARRGRFVPPYDTAETLTRLAAVIERFKPQTIVALGDSLHETSAASRLSSDARTALAAMQLRRSWVWITGNHDPEIGPELGGEALVTLNVAALTFRHHPSTAPVRGEICGHLHPAARLATRAGPIRRPCFIGDGHRLVIPAFGAFTGGLNILDEAFAPLFSEAPRVVHMASRDGVYCVPLDRLQPD